MKTILYILTSILLVSCLTSRKANKQLDKIEDKFPEKIAEFARDKNPCIDLGSDTTITLVDSIVYVQCPDEYVTVVDTVYRDGKTIIKIDTLSDIKGKKMPVSISYRVLNITKREEDSAKIKAAYIVRDAAIKDSAKAVTNLRRKVDRRTTLIWVFVIAFCISALGNFILLKIRR